MRLLNLLSFDIKSYIFDLVGFLKLHLNSEIMAWVTVGIIGFLAVCLFICTIIAIFNPARRKLKKLNKKLTRQQEYDNTRNRIFELSEEIGSANLEIRIIKKQLEDDIFNLTALERSALEQDNLFIENKKHQIEDLKERQEILCSALEQKKKGLLKTMQKDKIESAQLLIKDLVSQQREVNNEIYWKNVEIEKRRIQLETDIKTLTANHNAKIKELTNKLQSCKTEKTHLESRLAKMDKSGRHKLTLADAKAMIDEYARLKRQQFKEHEDLALDALKKAKADYESAKDRRNLAEKNKSLAVENVKTLQKERSKSKHRKPVKYTPVTNATFVPGDKPEDVNIIIADINSEAVFTPVIAEETIIEDKVEHVYEEPAIEVLDVTKLPEEDVVFIEAFLDYLNVERENYAEEVAAADSEQANENTQTDTNEVGISTESDSTSAEQVFEEDQTALEQKQEIPEVNVEYFEIDENNIAQPEIEITPTQNDREIENDKGVKTVKRQPTYKNYNDGIPATPVYMKNKFQKPVTKLVKKAKPVSENTQSQASEASAKSGYNGKWKIEELDGKYVAKLFASNGGALLSTSSYTSVNGAKDCISKIKDCLLNDRFVILADKDGKHFFKVLSTSNRTILQSSKYSTKYQCEKAVASAKKFAQTAAII